MVLLAALSGSHWLTRSLAGRDAFHRDGRRVTERCAATVQGRYDRTLTLEGARYDVVRRTRDQTQWVVRGDLGSPGGLTRWGFPMDVRCRALVTGDGVKIIEPVEIAWMILPPQ